MCYNCYTPSRHEDPDPAMWQTMQEAARSGRGMTVRLALLIAVRYWPGAGLVWLAWHVYETCLHGR
jgi:hypothetical protein